MPPGAAISSTHSQVGGHAVLGMITVHDDHAVSAIANVGSHVRVGRVAATDPRRHAGRAGQGQLVRTASSRTGVPEASGRSFVPGWSWIPMSGSTTVSPGSRPTRSSIRNSDAANRP